MEQCAPTVSKHFTEMTNVIIEGNSYEFPSIDLHKAILNKLIMNDSQHFKQFFSHIREQFLVNKAIITQKYPEFVEFIGKFHSQIEQDTSKFTPIE